MYPVRNENRPENASTVHCVHGHLARRCLGRRSLRLRTICETFGPVNGAVLLLHISRSFVVKKHPPRRFVKHEGGVENPLDLSVRFERVPSLVSRPRLKCDILRLKGPLGGGTEETHRALLDSWASPGRGGCWDRAGGYLPVWRPCGFRSPPPRAQIRLWAFIIRRTPPPG